MTFPVKLTRRSVFWVAISVLIFGFLLYLADVQAFVESIRQTDRSTFTIAFAIGFVSLLVWAWVWHRYFGQMGIESTPSRTVRMFLTGHFLNSITPLGQFGGEPIMAYIVSKNSNAEFEDAFACVVSADILNAVPFFTFTLGGVMYLAVTGTLSNQTFRIGVLSIVLLLSLGSAAAIMWSEKRKFSSGLHKGITVLQRRIGIAEERLESAKHAIENIEEAFQTAGSDSRFLIETALISHLAIIAQIVSLYFVFHSIGLRPDFVSLYFIVTLSVIATLSPTPGGSGTYEAAFTGLVLLFYPVAVSTAVTTAVLFRLTTYWPGLLAGLLSFFTLDQIELTA